MMAFRAYAREAIKNIVCAQNVDQQTMAVIM